MSETENQAEPIDEAKERGTSSGRSGGTFFHALGVVGLLLLGLALLVGVFLGHCWVIAWMVARFFL